MLKAHFALSVSSVLAVMATSGLSSVSLAHDRGFEGLDGRNAHVAPEREEATAVEIRSALVGKTFKLVSDNVKHGRYKFITDERFNTISGYVSSGGHWHALLGRLCLAHETSPEQCWTDLTIDSASGALQASSESKRLATFFKPLPESSSSGTSADYTRLKARAIQLLISQFDLTFTLPLLGTLALSFDGRGKVRRHGGRIDETGTYDVGTDRICTVFPSHGRECFFVLNMDGKTGLREVGQPLGRYGTEVALERK